MKREAFTAAYREVRCLGGRLPVGDHRLLVPWLCVKYRETRDFLELRPVVILDDVRCSSRIRWSKPRLPA